MPTLPPNKRNTLSQLELHFQLFVKGEEKGINFIYNRLFRYLFNFSRTIIKNEFAINSIIQNAFIKTWLRRETMEGMLHLQRYLFCYVKWECYRYLNNSYYIKRLHLLPNSILDYNQSEELLNEDINKYESGELLILIKQAIPYLKVNKKILMKLHTHGLSYRYIHKAVSEQYQYFTQEICYRMKVLKTISKKIEKTKDSYKKENFKLEATVQNYLSPLQCKIFHYYYKYNYSLNKIAEDLNISLFKVLQHHFYIIRIIEKSDKKLSHRRA